MAGLPKTKARRDRGVAAVEFAIILPLILVLLAFPVFFGRVFMFYSVAQKAAQNAAQYIATVPKVEMHDSNKAAAANDVAKEIIRLTMGEVSAGSGGIGIQVDCDDGECGTGEVPTEILVNIRLVLYDDYFAFLTYSILGDGPLVINANAKVKYLGT